MVNRPLILNVPASLIAFIFWLFIASSAHAIIHKEGYIDVDGAKLFYQSIGSDDPIIVLHGGPGLDQSYLLPQMTTLSKKHEVTFYDQRGSGKSYDTSINDHTITMHQFVEDLDKVRAALGYSKFTLVGHSWGGLLAMNYAIAYPDHLNAVVLLNTVPATHTGFMSFVKEYDRRTVSIRDKLTTLEKSTEFKEGDPKTMVAYFRLIFEKYFANPKDVNKINLEFTNQSALNGFKVSAILQRNYLDTPYNLLPELSKLDIPTLIIHGSYDLVPVETAKEIKNAIPNAQILILNHSGHFVYIEQPKEFLSAIETFLAKYQKK